MTDNLPQIASTVNTEPEAESFYPTAQARDRRVLDLCSHVLVHFEDDYLPGIDEMLYRGRQALAVVERRMRHDLCLCLSCLRHEASGSAWLMFCLRGEVAYRVQRYPSKIPHTATVGE